MSPLSKNIWLMSRMRARLPLLLIHVTDVATFILTVEGSKPPDNIDTLTLPVGVQPGPGVPVVVPVAPGVVLVVPVAPGVVVPVVPGVVVSVLPAVPVAPGVVVVVSEAKGTTRFVLPVSMPANRSELAEAVEASNTSPSLRVLNLKRLPEKKVAPNMRKHKAAKVTAGRYQLCLPV